MSATPRVAPAPARIRQLSETLVNRIAAGEVIERPAAVVKELVENALDAGATRIAVSLSGGGIARIEVTDDGAGMGPEDLALAVQRHCTSKLTDETLVQIATLGFRGEALPSIGAAARLSIVSRPPAAAHGFRIAVAGGLVEPVAPAPAAHGTRVTVEDLFYATPARRKFLKTPRSEADHAEAATRRLALAAPQVAFRLIIEGRTLYDLPAQDRQARVAALLGQDAAQSLLEIEASREEMRLSGFICAPMVSRSTAAGQSLVVNGRPVTDPVLRVAVRVAYREVIAQGRYPVVALWLDLPPEALDVNVHPAKSEVRFRDADTVRSLVIGALQRRLAGGAGLAAPRPDIRPSLQLVGRHPGTAARFTGFAEAQLPFAPSARPPETPAPPDATHPLGAPSPRCSTPISSPPPPMRNSSWSTSTPPMNGSPMRRCAPNCSAAACVRRRCCCRPWSICRRPTRPAWLPPRTISPGSGSSWRRSAPVPSWCGRCPPPWARPIRKT